MRVQPSKGLTFGLDANRMGVGVGTMRRLAHELDDEIFPSFFNRMVLSRSCVDVAGVDHWDM